MKIIKNLIWIMVLIWFSTVVYNSVYDIYVEGGLWSILAWIMLFILASIWLVTSWAALKIISKKEKSTQQNTGKS